MIADMCCSVLLVDDDHVFRGLLRLMLVADGFVVVGEAGTAAAAIVAAHELKPKGILVDVGLPDRDGVALAGELVALPWRPRVVLTSTNPDITRAHYVQRSGAGAFVAKDELPLAPLRQLLASD